MEEILVDRLEQIGKRVFLEGLEGMLLEARRENDQGCGLWIGQLPQHLKAVESRHLNIEKNDIRQQQLDLLQTGQAMLGLAHHFHLRVAAQQSSKALSCGQFVIDEQDSHGPPYLFSMRGIWTGISTQAHTPPS